MNSFKTVKMAGLTGSQAARRTFARKVVRRDAEDSQELSILSSEDDDEESELKAYTKRHGDYTCSDCGYHLGGCDEKPGSCPKCGSTNIDIVDLSPDDDHHVDECGDLIERMGISAMIMIAKPGWEFAETALVAVQGFVIQAVVLCYVYQALQPCPDPTQRVVTRPILWAAIYLHFVNCVTDLPYSCQVLMHLHHFREGWFQKLIGYPIFCGDAFIVPLTTLFIGALYLCTSNTAEDVIFNSCAVAFISSIDNYLLTLHGKMKSLKGEMHTGSVAIPRANKFGELSLWALIYFPIIPCAFAYGTVHIAYDVLKY